MVDVASLGLAINSQPVTEATRALDNLARSAAPATAAVKQLEQAAGVGLKHGLDNLAQSGRQSAQVIAMNSGQMRQLSFQLNDAATMLASGSSPFQVLATQGGQVFQALQGPQGVVGSLKQIGLSLMGLAGPAKIAGVALAGAAITGIAAWNSWDNRIKAVQQSLNGLGAQTGLTTQRIVALAEASTRNSPMSFGNAMAGATTFAGAGIYGSVISGLNPAARQYAGATGTSLADSQQLLAEIFADPSKGFETLRKTLGDLGLEVELEVRRLQSLGQMENAQLTLLKAFQERMKGTIDTTGLLAQAFEAARGVFSRAWTFIGSVGAPSNIEQSMGAIKKQYDIEARTFNRQDVLDDLFAKYISLQKQAAEIGITAEERKKKAEQERIARIEFDNRRITEMGEITARGIVARTAAEKLSAEIERIRKEAIFDTSKAAQAGAEAERARTLAIADATKALRDHQRAVADEVFMGGARTPLDEFRRRTQLEARDLYERTNVLGRPPDDQWYNKFTNRADTGFYPSPNSPFAFPNVVSVPTSLSPNGNALGALSRFMGQFGIFSNGDIPGFSPASAVGSSPRQLTVTRGANPNAPGAVDEDRVGEWLRNRTEQIFFDSERSIEANRRALDASNRSFGQSAYEVGRSTEEVRLQNELYRLGLKDISGYSEQIRKLAEMEGKLAEAREQSARKQQLIIQALDDVRGGFSDALSSPLKAMARGENVGQAFQQSLTRILDRGIDRSVGLVTEGIFGPNGKAGGGAIGGFLAQFLGAKQNTAQMNVQAGIVNVGGAGAIPGATGGSGGIGGWFSSLFPGSGGTASSGWDYTPSMDLANSWSFANGGIMTSRGAIPLRTYAKGGVANTPQMAIYGEGSGPEAYVPLPDGRSIPVSIRQKEASIAGSSRGDSGTDVRVYDHSGQKIETRKGRGPNGRQYVDIIISEVGAAIASGQMDTAFRGRYGAQPVSVRR